MSSTTSKSVRSRSIKKPSATAAVTRSGLSYGLNTIHVPKKGHKSRSRHKIKKQAKETELKVNAVVAKRRLEYTIRTGDRITMEFNRQMEENTRLVAFLCTQTNFMMGKIKLYDRCAEFDSMGTNPFPFNCGPLNRIIYTLENHVLIYDALDKIAKTILLIPLNSHKNDVLVRILGEQYDGVMRLKEGINGIISQYQREDQSLFDIDLSDFIIVENNVLRAIKLISKKLREVFNTLELIKLFIHNFFDSFGIGLDNREELDEGEINTKLTMILGESLYKIGQPTIMYFIQSIVSYTTQYTNSPEFPETNNHLTYSLIAMLHEIILQIRMGCERGLLLPFRPNRDCYPFLINQHRLPDEENSYGPRIDAMKIIYTATKEKMPGLKDEILEKYDNSLTAMEIKSLIGYMGEIFVYSGLNESFFRDCFELNQFMSGMPKSQFVKSFTLYYPVAKHFASAYSKRDFFSNCGIPDYMADCENIFKIILWMHIGDDEIIPYVSNKFSWEAEVLYPEGEYIYINHHVRRMVEEIYTDAGKECREICVLFIQVRFVLTRGVYMIPTPDEILFCAQQQDNRYKIPKGFNVDGDPLIEYLVPHLYSISGMGRINTNTDVEGSVEIPQIVSATDPYQFLGMSKCVVASAGFPRIPEWNGGKAKTRQIKWRSGRNTRRRHPRK